MLVCLHKNSRVKAFSDKKGLKDGYINGLSRPGSMFPLISSQLRKCTEKNSTSFSVCKYDRPVNSFMSCIFVLVYILVVLSSHTI